MCGIGGAIDRSGRDSSNLNPLLRLILEDQRKRGPDHSSLQSMNRENLSIYLAHNRLAILDLTQDANQPFVDRDSGACLVFNGEIYNFIELRRELEQDGVRFETHCDTEVLLKAYLTWGLEAMVRLNGMFAFAIWDPRRAELILARDRFGVKPCYYMDDGQQFVFASTASAMAKFFKPEVDQDYLSRGILYNLYEDESGASPFGKIRALAPGHCLIVKGHELRLSKFYDLKEAVEREKALVEGLSEPQLLQLMEENLRSAVHFRLRSDVPLTISLSGGLDSALLAAYMMDEKNHPEEAFTLGTLNDNPGEAGIALQTATKVGLRLRFVDVNSVDICDLFERTLATQGAPFAHPSVMSQNLIFEHMHRAGYKVSIGGQGADEVFMGYRKFQFFRLREIIQRREYARLPQAIYGLTRMLLAEVGSPQALWYYQSRYSRKDGPRSPFLHSSPGQSMCLSMASYKSLLERQMVDLGFASLSTLLRYEDRNSMGHSIESRMPFLDFRVVQTGLALPIEMKLNAGYGKWILRKLARGRLPDSVVFSRAKLAFSLNTNAWFENGLGDHLYAKIKPALSRLAEVLTPEARAVLAERANYNNVANFPLLVTARFLADHI